MHAFLFFVLPINGQRLASILRKRLLSSLARWPDWEPLPLCTGSDRCETKQIDVGSKFMCMLKDLCEEKGIPLYVLPPIRSGQLGLRPYVMNQDIT